MARTTPERVEDIIEVDPAIALDPFIEAASSLVEELCAPAGYSDERLELIERWLSAHFYAIRDMRRSLESAGAVSEQYQFKVDLGLDVTVYGQQAKLLDTKGKLKALDEGRIGMVDMFWLGNR